MESANEYKVKAISMIFNETITAIEKLNNAYDKLKLSGFLIVAGTVIGILTIILSFITGSYEQPSWLGINLIEEIVFISFSALLIIIGIMFKIKVNQAKENLQREIFEIEKARDKFIFKLKLDYYKILKESKIEDKDQVMKNLNIDISNLFSEI